MNLSTRDPKNQNDGFWVPSTGYVCGSGFMLILLNTSLNCIGLHWPLRTPDAFLLFRRAEKNIGPLILGPWTLPWAPLPCSHIPLCYIIPIYRWPKAVCEKFDSLAYISHYRYLRHTYWRREKSSWTFSGQYFFFEDPRGPGFRMRSNKLLVKL